MFFFHTITIMFVVTLQTVETLAAIISVILTGQRCSFSFISEVCCPIRTRIYQRLLRSYTVKVNIIFQASIKLNTHEIQLHLITNGIELLQAFIKSLHCYTSSFTAKQKHNHLPTLFAINKNISEKSKLSSKMTNRIYSAHCAKITLCSLTDKSHFIVWTVVY